MQISITTVEISMGIPQKARDRTAIRSSDTSLGIYPQEHKSGSNRDTCTPMFNHSIIHNLQAMETTKMPYT
jgi:hypothetical protein